MKNTGKHKSYSYFRMALLFCIATVTCGGSVNIYCASATNTAKIQQATVTASAPLVSASSTLIPAPLVPCSGKFKDKSCQQQNTQKCFSNVPADQWLRDMEEHHWRVIQLFMFFVTLIIAILGLIGFDKSRSLQKDLDNAISRFEKRANETIKNVESKNQLLAEKRGQLSSSPQKPNPEIEEEIKEAVKEITNKPDNEKTAYDYFVRALSVNNPELAITLYTKAIELKPDYADAYNNRGMAYSDSGNIDKAISDYDKAIILEPNSSITYGNRGNAYSNIGIYDKALNDHNKAIEINPNDAVAYFNRSITNKDKGAIENEISDLSKAIELKPDYIDAYINRGVAYAKMGNNELSIKDFNSAIHHDPDSAIAYCNRGNALVLKADIEGAIDDYIRSIQLKPDYTYAYGNLTCAYAIRGKEGDIDNAFDSLKKATDLGFDNIEAMRTDPALTTLRSDPRFNEIIKIVEDNAKKNRQKTSI